MARVDILEQGGRYIESTEDFLRRTGHWLDTEPPEEEIDVQLASDFADFAEPALRALLQWPLRICTATSSVSWSGTHPAWRRVPIGLTSRRADATRHCSREGTRLRHGIHARMNVYRFFVAEADAAVDEGGFTSLARVEDSEEGEPAEDGAGGQRDGSDEQDTGDAPDL